MSPTRRSFVKLMLAAPVATAFVWPETKPAAAQSPEEADREFRALSGSYPNDQWERQMRTIVVLITSLKDGVDLDMCAQLVAECPFTSKTWRTDLTELMRRTELILERMEETYG